MQIQILSMANKNTIHPSKGSVSPNHCISERGSSDNVSLNNRKKKNNPIKANIKSLGVGFLDINDSHDGAEVNFEGTQEEAMNIDSDEKTTDVNIHMNEILDHTIIIKRDLQPHCINALDSDDYNDDISAVSLSERFYTNLSSSAVSNLCHRVSFKLDVDAIDDDKPGFPRVSSGRFSYDGMDSLWSNELR